MTYPGGMSALTSCAAAPDEMLTMLPPPVRCMCGVTARVNR